LEEMPIQECLNVSEMVARYRSIAGHCRWGSQCNFAHGESELRPRRSSGQVAISNRPVKGRQIEHVPKRNGTGHPWEGKQLQPSSPAAKLPAHQAAPAYHRHPASVEEVMRMLPESAMPGPNEMLSIST